MELGEILKMDQSPKKTALLAAWVQGLYPDEVTPPILVGGAAVELYTRGSYVTGDLDFVGSVPVSVGRLLRKSGFRKEGRHWLHEKGKIFLEFPGQALADGAETAVLEAGRQNIVIISPESLLADRLRSLVFWHYREDGMNAFLLAWAQRKEISASLVRRLVKDPAVRRAFDGIWRLIRRAGDRKPTAAAIDRWIERNL